MHALEDTLIEFGITMLCVGTILAIFFTPPTLGVVLSLVGLVSLIAGIVVARP